MGDFSRQAGNVMRKITGVKPSGHGPYHEATDGWVDAKPYVDVLSDGTFEGYDNSQWLYFGFPEDVKVKWLKDPNDIMRNQHFFVDLVNTLSARLNNLSDSDRGDERRKLHILTVMELYKGIKPHSTHAPKMRDYLERMSNLFSKPIWYGYVGLKLIPTNGLEEAHGLRAKAERWWEMAKNPEDLPLHLYQADRNDVTQLMIDHGFIPLDFSTTEGAMDYERLTAWHGISDTDFNLHRELVNVRTQEPLHGASIITPRWGEITMSAVKPSPERFMTDPISDTARWFEPIFSPGNNAVVCSIRTEVRSARVADAMFENKHIVKKGAARRGKSPRSHTEQEMHEMSMLDRARSFAQRGHGMLDYSEIIVGTMVTDDRVKNQQLDAALKDYGLKTHPLINRQPIALNSTFPTYPKPILPQPRSSRTRPVLSSQMYAGVIAMSGIFRSTKPNCDRGFLIGLSDGGSEYKEIWTDIEGPNKESESPGMLYSGRPGAGKTQAMIQHLVQNRYNGYRCFFLNPKPQSSLAPVFNLIGGAVVSISNKFLSENPGCMDPILFLADRNDVSAILQDAIYMLAELGSERGVKAAIDLSTLNAEIAERSRDLKNVCTGDIIFGRADEKPIKANGTPGISNEELKQIISNNMRSSPFWKAFIAMGRVDSRLYNMMRGSGDSTGVATLIEWEQGLHLPSNEEVQSGSRLTSAQIDSLVSANAAFKYAEEIVGHSRQGGGIWVDEAWFIMMSESMKRRMNAGLREYRERNIGLFLGTQRLGDFMGADESSMASYFSRFLIMAISDNDPDELDRYFKLTGLPRTPQNEQYIINAGAKKMKNGRRSSETQRVIPRAYFIDRIYKYEGGVIMGPWPTRELNAGRTDREAYEAKLRAEAMSNESQMVRGMGQLGGDLRNDEELIRAMTEDSLDDIDGNMSAHE